MCPCSSLMAAEDASINSWPTTPSDANAQLRFGRLGADIGGTPDSYAVSESPGQIGAWEDNSTTCNICNKQLGKRYARPRHHCRICHRSVCNSCSPNRIQFAIGQDAERACTQCCLSVVRHKDILARSISLHKRLLMIGNSDEAAAAAISRKLVDEAILGLPKVLEFLEAAIGPAEDASRQTKDQLVAAQAQAAEAVQAGVQRLLHLAQRLHDLGQQAGPAVPETCSDFQEAFVICEAQLAHLDTRGQRRGGWFKSKAGADAASNMQQPLRDENSDMMISASQVASTSTPSVSRRKFRWCLSAR